MQRWEYKTILRSRSWEQTQKNADWMRATDWNVDLEKMLEELGKEGWELVAVSPRSDYLGGKGWQSPVDFAGFTNAEIWVFKRPKS